MEPRAAIGDYDPASGRYTIYTGNGSTLRLRKDLAIVLGVPEDEVRLVIGDVGGNFGTRGAIFAEQPLVAWAARRLGRPVKWTADRSECLLSDYQGRDLAVEAELALDADGNFLAMRGDNIGNLGAHTGNFSMVQKGVEIMSSIYRMPAAHFRARCVMSNTAPDAALSQRRPARGDVRDGAPDRHRRAAMRLRPDRAATAQPHLTRRSCPTATRSAWSTTAAPITT